MKKYILIFIAISLLLVGCESQNDREVVETSKVQETTISEEANENVEGQKAVEEDTSIPKYRKISPQEAKEMMVEGNVILDVRTNEEYNAGHIENSILLPVDSILKGDYSLIPDKNKIILVYCRSGNRSATASKALVEAGYMQIYDFGGINDWPYEIVK